MAEALAARSVACNIIDLVQHGLTWSIYYTRNAWV